MVAEEGGGVMVTEGGGVMVTEEGGVVMVSELEPVASAYGL